MNMQNDSHFEQCDHRFKSDTMFLLKSDEKKGEELLTRN